MLSSSLVFANWDWVTTKNLKRVHFSPKTSTTNHKDTELLRSKRISNDRRSSTLNFVNGSFVITNVNYSITLEHFRMSTGIFLRLHCRSQRHVRLSVGSISIICHVSSIIKIANLFDWWKHTLIELHFCWIGLLPKKLFCVNSIFHVNIQSGRDFYV